MKKIVQLTSTLLVFFILIVAPGRAKAQNEEEKKVIAFSKEADWKLIYNTHIEFMDKLVNAGVDLASMDFKDENSILKAVKMSRREYLAKVEQVKAASNRLVEKYNIEGDCSSCRQGEENVRNKFQDIAVAFQKDPESYNNYKNALIVNTEAAGWCCGWRFYACCVVCAGTIAAFPAYLACCALCFDSYCCKPSKS
jgi:hypothetical protein